MASGLRTGRQSASRKSTFWKEEPTMETTFHWNRTSSGTGPRTPPQVSSNDTHRASKRGIVSAHRRSTQGDDESRKIWMGRREPARRAIRTSETAWPKVATPVVVTMPVVLASYGRWLANSASWSTKAACDARNRATSSSLSSIRSGRVALIPGAQLMLGPGSPILTGPAVTRVLSRRPKNSAHQPPASSWRPSSSSSSSLLLWCWWC
ncbi:hypothetical protein VTG60DRAFT_1792 [Thermothelomyces hinnuleus]